MPPFDSGVSAPQTDDSLMKEEKNHMSKEPRQHYRNFRTVTYIPAAITQRGTRTQIERDLAFLEKYVGLDKVYLETFRGDTFASKEKVLLWKSVLEDHGVEVSGGFTTVMPDIPGNGDEKRQRLFGTLCYSNEAMRRKIKEVSEFTAGIFDEVILDDFYFTNCTCEDCIRKKGKRTWKEFRRDLMVDASKNLIVGPAKKVNPNVKMIVKFPNWRESFALAGYRPGEEKDIFDKVYTGTETRMAAFQDQHLPGYLSYSLMRWMENAALGRNGGGWLDTYQCWSTDRYLEQAYLTVLSRGREVMLFQWSDLIGNKFTAPLGIQLHKLDEYLSKAGKPVGVPCYIPFASSGENHVEMRLGMQGIPIEPTPYFPENAKTVLLTESSLEDKDIFAKIRGQLLSGRDVVVTSGFVQKAPADLWHEYSELFYTGRKITADRYWITDDRAGYIDGAEPVLFPDMQHGNNASWALLDGGSGDYHCALFTKSPYGPGRLFTLSIPENPDDLSRMPEETLDPVKKVMNVNGLYVTGRNVSLFQYDDGTFVLYRYVTDPIHDVRVTVHAGADAKELVSLNTNPHTGRKDIIPLREVKTSFDLEGRTEKTAQLILPPGEPAAFRLK